MGKKKTKAGGRGSRARNGNKDYFVDAELRAMILYEVKRYHYHCRRIDELTKDLDSGEGIHIPSVAYDKIYTSPTNSISRPTEEAAFKRSEKRKELNFSEAIVRATDRGISRAANVSPRLDKVDDLKKDIRDNLVNGVSRDNFDRDSNTIAKYRKIAVYYIAVELGLIKDAR